MFKIEKPKEIIWPVTVSIPRDGGNIVKATFGGKFKIIPSAEFNAIYKNGGTDEDLVRAVLRGWLDDLCDDAGQPIEFNDENLNIVASVPYIRAAVVEAYMDLAHGRKAGVKN